jgi:peptidoglycan/xylan/chitin deacetylase (PgdA/CDA1 family)
MNKLMNSSITTAPFELLTSLLSPGGKNARLSILIYHRVLMEPDLLLDIKDDFKNFDTQINYLNHHFNVLPLYEAVQRLRSGTLPARAACITFDDGYADNAEIALPILQKYGVSATFFIATGFINGGIMWNDRLIELIRRAKGDTLDLERIGKGKHAIKTVSQRHNLLFNLIKEFKHLPFEIRQLELEKLQQIIPEVLPDDFMMTSEQIRKLHHAGMEIGAHTVEHPILTRIENDKAYAEMVNSKETLENIIGNSVRLFAYPNGEPGQDYLPEHIAMAKEIGFEAAVSTAWGTANSHSDLFQLPRFTPWDISRSRFILRMAQNMLRTPEVV